MCMFLILEPILSDPHNSRYWMARPCALPPLAIHESVSFIFIGHEISCIDFSESQFSELKFSGGQGQERRHVHVTRCSSRALAFVERAQ